jgi:hypothetical protein
MIERAMPPEAGSTGEELFPIHWLCTTKRVDKTYVRDSTVVESSEETSMEVERSHERMTTKDEGADRWCHDHTREPYR